MSGSPTTPRWARHLFYRAEQTRTTWKLRLALLTVVIIALRLTSGWWTVTIARSLVCDPTRAPSDAILIENVEPNYLLFERAARLRRAGLAARVLVPIRSGPAPEEPDEVALGIALVMARVAGTGRIESVPTRAVEPIALNVARDVQRFVEREHIGSIIVVTPLFRSRRSALVYGATLGRAGVTVRFESVQGSWAVNDWTLTWHGIQEVVEQCLKLQYYRLYVLPFASHS